MSARKVIRRYAAVVFDETEKKNYPVLYVYIYIFRFLIFQRRCGILSNGPRLDPHIYIKKKDRRKKETVFYFAEIFFGEEGREGGVFQFLSRVSLNFLFRRTNEK